MAYSKQTWDTTSYVNPTRMNHIEEGIEGVDNYAPKQVSYTGTTNSVGALTGASADFGMSANAIPIGAYLERGSYGANRYVQIRTYGNKGINFTCYDGETPIANSSVTLSIVYVDRFVNN